MTKQKAYYDQVYHDCINFCISGDAICLAGCSRELNANLLGCPCQDGCPHGCPCEDYVCPTTAPSTTSVSTTTTTATSTTSTTSTTTTLSTTTSTTPTSTTTSTLTTSTSATSSLIEVLILNTAQSNNVPVITNASGREDRDFSFEFGADTEVNFSCGLTYRGEHFVFGGDSKSTQIAKIDGCQLKIVGQLDFEHQKGACANVAEEQIYLCFNFNSNSDYKKCRKASSPLGEFEEIRQSAEEHRSTRIAASQSKLIINQFIASLKTL